MELRGGTKGPWRWLKSDYFRIEILNCEEVTTGVILLKSDYFRIEMC